MQLFCTAKTATEVGDTVECSVFVLQFRKLEPGTKIEQRRENVVLALWELVEQTPHTLILKREQPESLIEFSDSFYVEAPIVEAPKEVETMSVYIFGGKNWKLASMKKWVPAKLVVDGFGYEEVGEITIDGKDCIVLKLPESFVARPKTLS